MARCPICGSSDTSRTKIGEQVLKFGLGLGLTFLMGGKPNGGNVVHSTYKCNCCGHEWEAS